jgi:hypothetical protein
MPLALLLFGYFWDRISHLCPGWPELQFFCLCQVTGMGHHAQHFIGWDGVSSAFCLGWPQTSVFQSSTLE